MLLSHTVSNLNKKKIKLIDIKFQQLDEYCWSYSN